MTLEPTPDWDVAFRDLEQLLFQGFLTQQITLGGVRFQIKTLSPAESQQVIDYLYEDTEHPGNLVVRLAYHLFKINGDNLLPFRQEDPHKLMAFVSSLPHVVTRFLLDKADDLLWRATVVETYLTSYCFMDSSRRKWLALKGQSLNDPALTGVTGTDFLGLNTLQADWVAFNRMEDERGQLEDNWDLATMVAAFINPEAGKKITKHEEIRRRNRDSMRATFLQGLVEVEDPTEDPDSTESLLKQLAKDMAGIKDEHDNVIASLEKNLDKELTVSEAVDYGEDETVGLTGGNISEADFIQLLQQGQDQSPLEDMAYEVTDRQGELLTGDVYRKRLKKLSMTRGEPVKQDDYAGNT